MSQNNSHRLNLNQVHKASNYHTIVPKVRSMRFAVLFLIAAIATVTAIGFSITACGDKEDDMGLTITGLGKYNGKFVFALCDDSDDLQLIAAADIDVNNENVACGKIGGGSVTLNVWKVDSEGNPVSYDGNDTATFYVIICKEATLNAATFANIENDNEDMSESISMELLGKMAGYGTMTVTFKKGVASGKVDIMPLPIAF